MAEGQPVKFWEIAGMVLSIVQMVFYIIALNKYKDKLIELAEKFTGYAQEDEALYDEFRSADPAFYNWYMGLPNYSACEGSVQRSKGQAFLNYGETLRKSKRLNRGFTPLAPILVSSSAGDTAVRVSSMRRAASHASEETRVNDHVLSRWQAIASAPVGAEGNISGAYKPVIDSTMGSFTNAARGFNSAALAFGVNLYRVTH